MKNDDYTSELRDSVRRSVGSARVSLSELMKIQNATDVAPVLTAAGLSPRAVSSVITCLVKPQAGL